MRAGYGATRFMSRSPSPIRNRTPVTRRIGFAVIGIGFGFPLMVGLLTFLVAQSFSTSSKVDRLSDQIAATRKDDTRLAERLDCLERPG